MAKNRPTIETERLLLRPFELSDGHRVKELAGDRSISDTALSVPYPFEDGMAEEWISSHQPKFEDGEMVVCAIVLKSSQELIGAIGLTIEKKFNRADLGYWVGKEYWNKGYCTETASAILNYAFDKLKLHKITAHHLTKNPASGKVMEKIGMYKEGLFKDHVIKWDKYEDIVMYGILNDRKQN